MAISWHKKVKLFKSPVRVAAAFLLRSRETLKEKNRLLTEQLKQRDDQLEKKTTQFQKLQKEIGALRRQANEFKMQRDKARRSVNLPEDPSMGTHGYGARMISLAVNVGRSVGFRGAERVLQLFFKWLDVEQKTPSRTSIRNWMQRLGIAELKQPPKPNNDLIVMVDHSNQIGTEKVLVALGVNTSELPEQGKALTHDQVRVLEVKPGCQWNTDNMKQAYESLAERHGAPRAVLLDGAVELRDGAKCLESQRSDTIVLRDFKHFAANVLKSLLGKDARFGEVGGKIGQTRSAIQQTELAHLTPPSPKQKARFMNLASTIGWMAFIVWLLRTPDAKSRQGLSDQRLRDKLGWVEQYADDIAVWKECQFVVSTSLTFINEQYLFKGAARALQDAIGDSLEHAPSKTLAKRLIEFVDEAEGQLREGERLPMSTEILESTFGLYKQLERQHSKSGFTSLLACLPTLLRPTTPDLVRESFARTSSKDVKAWVSQHFPSTVASRRRAAYAEHRAAQQSATAPPAPT